MQHLGIKVEIGTFRSKGRVVDESRKIETENWPLDLAVCRELITLSRAVSMRVTEKARFEWV